MSKMTMTYELIKPLITSERWISYIQVGDYVVLNSQPCQVTKIARSAIGKHGAPKLFLTGRDLITGAEQKHVEVWFEKWKEINDRS